MYYIKDGLSERVPFLSKKEIEKELKEGFFIGGNHTLKGQLGKTIENVNFEIIDTVVIRPENKLTSPYLREQVSPEALEFLQGIYGVREDATIVRSLKELAKELSKVDRINEYYNEFRGKPPEIRYHSTDAYIGLGKPRFMTLDETRIKVVPFRFKGKVSVIYHRKLSKANT